jgi:uncharacterized protein YcbK (DUF882 family)
MQWGAAAFLGASSEPLISTLSAAPSTGFAALPERGLSFYHLHTNETLKTVYWAQGEYLPSSLAEIHHILRDFRTGEEHQIDRRLLDLLCELRIAVGSSSPFEIISGYRSPNTNAALRSKSTGVAENSLHLKGMAADIRLRDKSLAVLRKAALSLRAGGVGYYPASQFIHVDVGRVRSW